MSISLHTQPYCENCPNFVPVCRTGVLKMPNTDMYTHDIYCENHDKCLVIAEYLQCTDIPKED